MDFHEIKLKDIKNIAFKYTGNVHIHTILENISIA